jgi:antitoxin (DNA-binding transcriptional repressor) of toxin-antitoxin stability system
VTQEADMTTVTVAEARENLADLLRRAAAGEPIVITEDGKWLAALTAPPPPPPTSEDEAQRRARAEEFLRQIAKWHEEDGLPFPPVEGPPAA